MGRSSRDVILGINAYHPDAAAAVLVDGELVAAAEEERFRRVKHVAGFPSMAIRACLEEARVAPDEIGWIAQNRDPRARLWDKATYALKKRPSWNFLRDRVKNARHNRSTPQRIAEALEVDPRHLRARFVPVEHHRAHLASAFYASPFEKAVVASIDGFGDFSSVAWGFGNQRELGIRGRVSFPHSLGMFYLAMTQYLGFHHYGDEYKVMGLAAHGRAQFVNQVARLVRVEDDGLFTLDLRYFRHHSEGVKMDWGDGANPDADPSPELSAANANACDSRGPTLGLAFSPLLEQLLGPARRPDEPVEERHRDLAASVQAVYEDCLMRLLSEFHKREPHGNLALAGGCAMNSLANGRILSRTPFRELYVPSAPGDSGGALGAALWVEHGVRCRPRKGAIRRADWGPTPAGERVDAAISARSAELEDNDVRVRSFSEDQDLLATVVDILVAGGVVGWCQGRAEFGPRALGFRSILADPRRQDMRERINSKIKLRESFRPFAPSCLAEEASEWFEFDGEILFMERVVRVRAKRRDQVPAITHSDGTARAHTVGPDRRDRFRRLLEVFAARTGVPMLLNTSFNENEPMVLGPEDALDCFLRTRMDAVVLGDRLVMRPTAMLVEPGEGEDESEGAGSRPRSAS